jgi:hypothetical protein
MHLGEILGDIRVAIRNAEPEETAVTDARDPHTVCEQDPGIRGSRSGL